MAQNAKPAAQKPDDPTLPKKNSKKLFIIIGVVLALAISAGAGWYFSKGKNSEHHAEETKVIPPKPPIFLALDPFTVNLQSEASDQYLQMGISMKFFDPEVEGKIKLSLPEIRSKILQLLTTKTASELLTLAGKNKLVNEIVSMSNPVIGIINAPSYPALVKPSMHPAAISQVTESGTEAQSITAAAAAPLPPMAPVEKKGIVDVLFTSFIIQ